MIKIEFWNSIKNWRLPFFDSRKSHKITLLVHTTVHINELSIQGNEITTHFLQHLQNIISSVSLYLFHLILMTRFPSWSNYSHLVIVVEDVVASIFSRYLYGILLEKNAVLNYRGNVGWLFPSNDASSLCKVSNEHSGVFARRQKLVLRCQLIVLWM